MNFEKSRIVIIGQGYVGLALALAFGKTYETVAYDIDVNRIEQLKNGEDINQEHSETAFKQATKLSFTLNLHSDKNVEYNFYIVTVPTPVDELNNPDLSLLKKACLEVGKILKKGDFVVFESTVYPGCTEELCIPLLEKHSNLKLNQDFFCGYSPERINPGDKVHILENIVKITSGSNSEAAKTIDRLYDSIIEAGTYLAPSIKVAESAKIIENCQRDVNIAFMNELSIVFDHLNINYNELLKAAQTKWNFLDFKPGLVGGNCIGVDPYYLIQKSAQNGYEPELLKAARKVNECFALKIAQKCISDIQKTNQNCYGKNCLIFGYAFKPNSPDIKNTKVKLLYEKLCEFGLKVDIFDPMISNLTPQNNMGELNIINTIAIKYHVIILATKHDEFLNFKLEEIKNENGKIYDLLIELTD